MDVVWEHYIGVYIGNFSFYQPCILFWLTMPFISKDVIGDVLDGIPFQDNLSTGNIQFLPKQPAHAVSLRSP